MEAKRKRGVGVALAGMRSLARRRLLYSPTALRKEEKEGGRGKEEGGREGERRRKSS